MTIKTPAQKHVQVPLDAKHLLTLCGSCCSNCPQIHLSKNNDEVLITDDYAGIVRMTKDEFRLFVEKAKSGELDGKNLS